MKNIFLFFLVCLVACQSRHAEETSQPKSDQEALLLYISSRGSGFDIYQNDTSGMKEIMLTGQEGWEWGPLWIPSQKRIIYNRQDTAGVFSIKAMDSEGNEVELDTQGLTEYILSPDGVKVAFTQKKGDFTNIYVLDVNAPQDTLNISNTDAYNGRPAWSPDSEKILFISDRNGKNEVYLYDFTTKETLQLTENELREKYLSWSPDGNQIAMTMQAGEEPNDIFILTLSDLSINQLTATDLNESEIAWSPLGDKIAYHAQVDEKDDIYLIDLVTKAITQITHGEGYHGEPTWMLK